MGVNPEQNGAARRRELAETRGRPVKTVGRSVVKQHRSYYVNLPELAVSLLNIDEEDDVTVEQYDDRVVIRPVADQEVPADA